MVTTTLPASTAGSATWNKRLIGAGLFRAQIARHGAELVLHGHNHRTQITSIAGAARPVPVVGAAAASQAPGHGQAGGSYNLFRIERHAGHFTCAMTERGVRHVGGQVETLSEQQLCLAG